jgi:diguanylate cyclase
MFACRFLNIDNTLPTMHRNMRALMWLNVVGLLTTPWMLEKYAAYVMSMCAGFSLLCLLVIGFKRLRDGVPLAGLYVLIYGLLIISSFLNVVASQGVLMDFVESHNFMKIASVIELMLLSIGVGYQITVMQSAQIRAERRARQFAQEARSAEQKALQVEREANRTLEDKVQLRTAELESALHDLHAANAQLKRLSELDPLTGLYNRRKFEACLREMMDAALEKNTSVSFFFIDIDHFKRFNDTYGHDVGDECLKQVSRILRKLGDRYALTVGRLGGEEFAAVAFGEPEKAAKVGEAIRAEIEHHKVMINGKELRITVSIGGHTSGSYDPEHKSQLMKVADEALYRAKEMGRNRVVMAGDEQPAGVLQNA